jgi:hypothetical protein
MFRCCLVHQSLGNKKVGDFIFSSLNVTHVAFSNGWMNWGSLPHPPQAVKGRTGPSEGLEEIHWVQAELCEEECRLGKAVEIRIDDDLIILQTEGTIMLFSP